MKPVAVALLLALSATPTLAVPTCDVPKGNIIVFEIGFGKEMGEIERAHFYEQRLNMMGIPARNTTFWNGCIQAEVRTNGHNTLRYYDPWTLEEVPID